ncbi:MAG TPA: S41 family peptidase [Candidatus Acidoferrales bacterium]|nr:S41 family peptidase [Candidatus Acidoferrales bacterium]
MSFRIRAIIAGLVILVATFGAAAYVSNAQARDGMTVALGEPTLMLDNFDSLGIIDQTYTRVEDVFYRPVALQTLLNGSRTGINAYLKARKEPFSAPALTSTGSRSGDAALVRKEVVELAARDTKLSQDDLSRAAIAGMLSGLDDPYTVYLTARQMRALNEELDGGDFGGIGVYIVQDPRTHDTLISPIPDNPAIAAGVKPGDIVLAVDGVSARNEPLDSIEHRIRGQVGTRVVLLLQNPKDRAKRSLTITRARVHVPSAVAKMDHGIDYIRLADFGTTSYDEVRKALLDGRAHDAKGYILDLRINGGGLLDAAVQISSLFIQSGTVVATIDREGDREARSALGVSVAAAPLVVLVDKYTASAAEITAGAIQDYRVGTIVGTKTFGKGVVQSIYNLPDHSALKITTARYTTPLGRDINKKGIMPDVVIPDPTTKGLPDLRKFGTASDRVYTEARAIIAKQDAQ